MGSGLRNCILCTLYLSEPGAYLKLDGGCLLVHKAEEQLLSVPLEKIDQVIVSDEGTVSFAALRSLLARGAGFFIDWRSGELPGHFVSALNTRIKLRALQHQQVRDDYFNLAIARALVAGKISNSRLVLNRYYRTRPDCQNLADSLMREAQAKALTAVDIDTLRGIEGAAAKTYFAAWRDLLPVLSRPDPSLMQVRQAASHLDTLLNRACLLKP